jgi:hypothetical protein
MYELACHMSISFHIASYLNLSSSGTRILRLPALDGLPRRELHGPVPLPPPAAGKLVAVLTLPIHVVMLSTMPSVADN